MRTDRHDEDNFRFSQCCVLLHTPILLVKKIQSQEWVWLDMQHV